MPRVIVAVLCTLAGSAWAGPFAVAPPEGKSSRTAETLWQLRGPVHAWLARDIGEKTRPENRAYADLILAYGLARAGVLDQAKPLLRETVTVLEQGDPAHRCLLGLFRFRIEQVLAGEPPTGPLPAHLLAPVTPTGKEAATAPIKMQQYIVLRLRENSRIVAPLEQVDPYLPWTSLGRDDSLFARLGPLQDEHDPDTFRWGARTLLGDLVSAPVDVRLRVMLGLVRLAPRAGSQFCVELLRGVPELIRLGREEGGRPTRDGAVALADQSLALVAGLKKPELLRPLAAEVIKLIKAERNPSAPGVVARLVVRCERGFRVMGLQAEAKAFLQDTAGIFPTGADTAALQVAAGDNWPDAARIRLAEAGLRRVAGKDAKADRLLVLVQDAVLKPPAGKLGVSYYRLVAEYVFACGLLPPVDAKQRIEEVFVKIGRVPDTYTTATHYSRYHLMILEAAVLGLLGSDDF